MSIPLHGATDLQLIPAHYVHSSGMFTLYDPVSKILFSGDIGAALLPKGYDKIYVEGFDSHIQYMEFFHKRWMPSGAAIKKWVSLVRDIDIKMMCPQHGLIFKGDDVQRFFDWFEALEVRSAL